MREQFEASMLRIHFGEDDRWEGQPLYEAIVQRCRDLGIAGATVYRAIEGFGASTLLHRSGGWSFSKDAPIMVSVVDTEEAMSHLLPALGEMVSEGLVVKSKVQVIRYSKSPSMP